VRRCSIRVRRGSVGSASGCCKVAPSSNLRFFAGFSKYNIKMLEGSANLRWEVRRYHFARERGRADPNHMTAQKLSKAAKMEGIGQLYY
jgi:hypothetical protein